MTIDENLVSRIRDTTETLRDDAVSFLCTLVNEGSLLGNEQGAQDIMAATFADMGLAVERFDIDLAEISHLPGFSPPVIDNYTGRENVIGLHSPRGEAQGKSLIMNGHIDVVPTGAHELWTNHPFEATVRDGRVYGRGSGDMKAGIVAYCMAFRALAKLGLQPASPVIMQSVIEEECTGNGALACLAKGYKADAAVIPEPMNGHLMTAQLGVMWLTVHLIGKPVHVADTSAGINAIESVYAVFEALKGLEEEWNQPENRHERYCDHTHPVNFNLGKLQGGEWASSVPCSASFDVRVGFYPGMTIETVQRALEDRIHGALKDDPRLAGVDGRIEYRGFQAEGCIMDEDSPLMEGISNAHRRVTNTPIEKIATTATTDCRFFELYGNIPATCYGPESDGYHGIDEWVSIESMMQVIQVLALFMADWCGVEERT
jgi:acetylornithine deacetylase